MYYIKLGGKISGPYSDQQLLTMLQRKEFSRLHLVSSDRRTWESAGHLVSLLEARYQSVENCSSRSDLVPAVNEKPDWYYAYAGDKRGPFTKREMIQLVSQGTVTRDTPVFASHLRSWQDAEQCPEFSGNFRSKVPFKRMAMIGAVSVGCLILVVVIVAGVSSSVGSKEVVGQQPAVDVKPALAKDVEVLKADLDKDLPPLPPAADDSELAIDDASDEEAFYNAVGLVVVALTEVSAGGETIDLFPLSTGSCFAVTSDGYLLTNRHVTDHEAMMRELGADTAKSINTLRQKVKARGSELRFSKYVFFRDRMYDMKVLFMSNRFDLAIGKIERTTPSRYFRLCRAPGVKRSDHVHSLGFPGQASRAHDSAEAAYKAELIRTKHSVAEMLLPREKEFSYYSGQVSRISTDIQQLSSIEHSARISHGNSGGPLIRDDGAVCGINTFMAVDEVTPPVLFSPEISQMRGEIEEHIPGGILWFP
ncbi:GYF domain-containing protein [Bremerella cremea]|uniref:GYF domain-containing protein n=1 Tax=Bremerella cremea TaxID=1031537 RepID=UPI0031EBD8C4